MPKLQNQWLLKHILKSLIPALQAMRFEWHKQKPAKEAGRAVTMALPFGTMRRINGNRMEIVEISLAKYDRSKFLIRIGTCPLLGFHSFSEERHYSAEEVQIVDLQEHWVLHSLPFRLGYFGYHFSWLIKRTELDYEKLVNRVVRLLHEIEMALAHDRCGPHVIRISFISDDELPPDVRRQRRISHFLEVAGSFGSFAFLVGLVTWLISGFSFGHSWNTFLYSLLVGPCLWLVGLLLLRPESE